MQSLTGKGNVMDADGVLERVVREMGIPIPGNGELIGTLRISEDLRIDSLQFILFILKTEQAVGRKVFSADTLGGLKTLSDIRNLINGDFVSKTPVFADGSGKEAT